MTFVVPFDGSELSETALVRAAEFGTLLDQRVLAFTVVPLGNTGYARERGWLEPGEPFDLDTVVSRLGDRVTGIYPDAEFRHDTTDRYASSGGIARRIRRAIREADASLVFIGSPNAGRVITSLSSVGGAVSAGGEYDVVIVRNRGPTRIPELDEASPVDDADAGTD